MVEPYSHFRLISQKEEGCLFMIQQVADRMRFFYSFVRSPKTVGSITPSSSFLTKRMFRDVVWKPGQTIIELGAGTGVFTEQIAKNLAPQSSALIFERDQRMRERLQKRFPHLFIQEDGLQMKEVLAKNGLEKADYIISGLPFANFSPEWRALFLDAIEQSLSENGLFIAYQYSRQLEKELKERFRQIKISLVPFNIPPAFVYTCSQLPTTSF